ncbi:uncharacterized protein At4g15970 [Brachypodium distachyon]|uniref:Nucleotide-diphospho-sugar transferase domain-containing protein n=1 Tax=Brachypodium distachyon TaxID=15368 RepID=I1IRK1_BRADI|nr:uncharacterized protein At4g15970 [Brachypodium distachyon]KQJ90911.1 hypothetical protein BRADI_4g34530v3 [Brachypodium distachyon]|eukprot:XP_010239417.3 uncharacterized protein At4g15970 [Brachypodium distachyon]
MSMLLRVFLGFFLGAALAATSVVLLLPPSRCPWGVEPADQGRALDSATQTDTIMEKLNTVQVAAPRNEDNLSELLRSAAMEDKTIILTFTNEALALPGSLLELFLESFRLGVNTQPLLKHLVIVAMDAKALERCLHMHPLCYSFFSRRISTGADLAAEVSFMSKDYLDMMWARNRFQARVLELGYGFVFTDVDIVWFRNPLLRIPVAADIAISCDQYYGDNPYDMRKNANGGFLFARPNARTRAFYEGWYEARARFEGAHEQHVFDQVKYELAAKHGMVVHFVDTAYFSGLCEPKKDFHKVCTFHANCLLGLQNKLDKLNAVLDEWKQFKAQQELLGSNSTALTF